MVKQLGGTSVWDHVRHILAGKYSQNMTPLAQQIIKKPPGKVCCPQNISSRYMLQSFLCAMHHPGSCA